MSCNNSERRKEESIESSDSSKFGIENLIDDSIRKKDSIQLYFESDIRSAILNNNVHNLEKLIERGLPLENIIKKTSDSWRSFGIERVCDSIMFKYIISNKLVFFSTHSDTIMSMIKAVESDNEQILEYWLKNSNKKYSKDKINIDDSGEREQFFSPFGRALYFDKFELIELFLKYNINITVEDLYFTKDKSVILILDSLSKNDKNIQYHLDYNLRNSAFDGLLFKTQELIKYGANVNFIDSTGNSVLFYTILRHEWPYVEPYKEKIKIAEYLLEKGANINYQNTDNQTVTLRLLSNQAIDSYDNKYMEYQQMFLDLFRKYKANFKLKDNNGKTSFDYLEKSKLE